MLKQKVNINSFQKNLPDMMELVMNGDEIIITKADIPIAKVTPILQKKVTVTENFIAAKAIETKISRSNEAPENWFG